MASLTDRMLRAAKLDVTVYEEVEADKAATSQALAVVVLSSLATGIGTGARIGGMVAGVLVSIAAWYVWAFLTYWVGTRILREPETQADHGELLRTIGFASSPGVLRLLGIVPGLRRFVFGATAIWMLVAGVIAVRQALDYRSTWRAVVVVAIGWAVQGVILAIFLWLLHVSPR